MSSVSSLRWVFVLLAFGGALGCGSDSDSLAMVGKRRIELESFQEYVLQVTGTTWQGVNARVASRLLDQFLDQQIVKESAGETDSSGAARRTDGDPIAMRMLLNELCGPPPPTTAAISDEVARRMEEIRPTRARVRQILVDNKNQAQAACQRLSAGEDFVELSREISRTPNAAEGGDLGFLTQGGLPPEIDQVVFSLDEGEISDPVEGPSGYHVFQVLDIVPAGPADRLQVEAVVQKEFERKALRNHTRDCIDRLANEVGVKVNRDRLWFEYEGRYTEVQNGA